ncbi:DMT family transporter [Sciscionella sediminilitoris]|uniref:DMT family transporter n=1 Tax=Sciscionella sediminilitoris TaxID=1445613 RepID=UPI0012E0E229|nr:DMT family transporter [Sciscionella sp. SE31]
MTSNRSWILYSALVVVVWGVWGALSDLPTNLYDYPDQMVYVIWALTMLIPCVFGLRGKRFDRRPIAAVYGLIVGLTGAGGQLLLFHTLTIGPAYLVFPITALSPAVTALMAIAFLRERLTKIAVIGLIAAIASLVLFNISGGDGDASAGTWLLLSIGILIAWGVQAFFMKKAASVGVNDGTTFAYMTISGLLLIPVAIAMMGGIPGGFPWQAPTITAVTQVLNAIGALFLVMAMSRGRATIVAPSTNALYPVFTAIVSLVIYQKVPSIYSVIGIVLAIGGSALMIYSDERRNANSVSGLDSVDERSLT